MKPSIPVPDRSVLRGLRFALIIADEAIGAGLQITEQDARDVKRALAWLDHVDAIKKADDERHRAKRRKVEQDEG